MSAPDRNGDLFLSELRRTSDIPVIFITANDTEQDMIKGFQLGCDDYISKPFSVDVLKERVGAILRRSSRAESVLQDRGGADKEVFRSVDLAVDFKRLTVTKAGQLLKLTATEYKLLEMLVKHKGQVLTRQILQNFLKQRGSMRGFPP